MDNVMSLLPHGHHAGMFIRAPQDAVAGCLVTWGNEDRVNRFTTGERQRLPLAQAWNLIAERNFTPDRAIVVPFAESWAAFFDNHRDEHLAAAELYILCERLKTEGYFFLYDDREGSAQRGSAQFCAYRFAGGVQQRQVMLYKESSWVFQQTGDPLPFEKVDWYALPKKRDRLTIDLLRMYGEALGIPFWNPDAYGQDVSLLRWGKKPTAQTAAPDSALRKVIGIFGRPSFIMDRHGLRRPPE